MQPKCSDDMCDDMLAAVLIDGFHTNQILPHALHSSEIIFGSE